jgi:hypothetical protein
MKFADEIMKNKKARLEQKLKEHNERVNEELLCIEKAINTYENDDKNTKPYIDIQMIIKTEEAKESLKEHRFYIDKVNQDIPYGVTRIYLDKTSYDIATRRDNFVNLKLDGVEANKLGGKIINNSKEEKLKETEEEERDANDINKSVEELLNILFSKNKEIYRGYR